MQYSVGVEYALHSLFYIIEVPHGKVVGIKELSALHGVSETYLSKIFTRLRKNGVVRSVSGVNGGYELSRSADQISFWDIIEAVEGSSYLFQCAEIRQNNILSKEDYAKEPPTCPCLIKTVMSAAEDEMRNYLRAKNLAWLKQEVYKDFSENKKEAIAQWVKNYYR